MPRPDMGRGGEPMTRPNYVIHGAGAIGSIIGARLAEGGARVQLVARGAHLEALSEHGLTMTGLTEGTFDLPASRQAHDLDLDADTVVLLATKSGDTPATMAAHAEVYRDLPLVCCQNGVTNEIELAAGGFRVYGCTVLIGGAIETPGHVWHSAGHRLVIGRWPTGIDDVCQRLEVDLANGGLDPRLHDEVRANKWGKLVRNLGNAFLALTDMSVQESTVDPENRWFSADVEEEAADVLEAAGIPYESMGRRSPREQIAHLRQEGTWERRDRGVPGTNSYPSTWQDLTAGRPTVEVDHFNGAIVRLGEQLGIPTPLNRILRDLCDDAAARGLGPGGHSAASLQAAAGAAGSPAASGATEDLDAVVEVED